MGCRQSNPEFLTLCTYNNILIRYFEELKNSRNDRESIEIKYDKEIQTIKETFPECNESEIKFTDILLDRNPFETILYWAVHSHWDSIRSTISDALLLEDFQENLEYFLSQEFCNIITDNSLSKELKSLCRTIPLYFYIHAPSSCLICYQDIFEIAPKKKPIKISTTKNTCINVFNKLKSNHIICNALRMLCDNISIDELFDHICQFSYYVYFPDLLPGLTTIGDYIFINLKWKHLDMLCQAATLVALLHESANLSKRFKKGQESYFEILKYDYEIGDKFETLIFGKKLIYVNKNSASYLMDPNNWELSADEFKRDLKENFTQGKENGLRSIKIRKKHDLDSTIVLGRCGMAFKVEQGDL